MEGSSLNCLNSAGRKAPATEADSWQKETTMHQSNCHGVVLTPSDDDVSSSGGSVSMVSDDFPSALISPSPEDDDDARLDFDLDAMETPSDSESLHFPMYDLDVEGERPEVKCVF